MNYYYELNKLARFYEGIQAFQKNAEQFLSKSNSFNNYDNYNGLNDCGNNTNNDSNIDLRLNLLKSYYINGNFTAIKAHIDNFEKTCNIKEFVKKFKLSAPISSRININNACNTFLKKIMTEYYNVIIIGNEYLSAYDKSAITKQILIYLEIFNTINSLKDIINTTVNEKEINNNDIKNIETDEKEIDNNDLITITTNGNEINGDDTTNIKIIIDRKEINNNDKIEYKYCNEPHEPDYSTYTYTYNYNYTPLFFDLCKYLYEFKEYEKLTFFYNMMNFSKKIYNDFKNSYAEEMYSTAFENYSAGSTSETFEEFDKIHYKINGDFDKIKIEESNAAYNNINSKFFDILNMWESRTKNYYTKDEICFSSAMFITNEYIPVLSELYNDIGNGNIYTDDNITGVIKANYSNALKLFKKAIALNSYNPDYYFNYAECLKKSGRSKDAEIFFKKAFESAL
ncbi:MAG: tetratricopeptide repeat protein [Candidatus Acididesulfobacter guangdongensis]|uniref:Tetratricopeptide repeat protein n=1 Tax=Acididesulfobacter guangdongensis TaxID=2597225 RepID=A0A519BEX1_ACIG2|nr:MAG: tetratricopeptide repeat protein [Candidatus Acididesulfobacter guangdongensis]